ncbi:MAG: TrkA family potassium uptake protein [Candidatus Gastranaerophilaceae bacterium]|nr:TrkA family potassium uptake protein [Candidatus Gastranaerophilaceae bacterium]
MKKRIKEQVLIIGLGQFGMALTKTLFEKGYEVIAVDVDKKLVNEASNYATDAICIDAIDEISLSKLSPKTRDLIICSIGAREPSILAVALLKQMGCENIVARASEAIHARILKAIGAKRIINPEYEYGKKFANKIIFKSIFLDNNADELELFEIPVQSFMIDKNLRELQLPDKYNVIVAGIMKDNKYTRPVPDEKFQPNSRLLVTGTNEDIEKMIKENN